MTLTNFMVGQPGWGKTENWRHGDHAHVKVQEMVRRIHLLKHMCDQMERQL